MTDRRAAGTVTLTVPPARVVRDAAARGRFTVALQPVVALPHLRVTGVEAFARFTGPPVAPPDLWFARAERTGVARVLELAVLRRVIRAWQSGPVGQHLSVNVSAGSLVDPDLLSALLAADLPYGVAVIEVGADGAPPVDDCTLAAVERLRAAGARIALSGAGVRYGLPALLPLLGRLRPDVVKLHRDVLDDVRAPGGARDVARVVVAHGRQHGAVLAVEGVETTADLQSALALGADEAQGFYFGHPSTEPAVWRAWARAALTA